MHLESVVKFKRRSWPIRKKIDKINCQNLRLCYLNPQQPTADSETDPSAHCDALDATVTHQTIRWQPAQLESCICQSLNQKLRNCNKLSCRKISGAQPKHFYSRLSCVSSTAWDCYPSSRKRVQSSTAGRGGTRTLYQLRNGAGTAPGKHDLNHACQLQNFCRARRMSCLDFETQFWALINVTRYTMRP